MDLKEKKELYSTLENGINLILFNNELSANLNDAKFMKSFAIITDNFKLLEEEIKPDNKVFNKFDKKVKDLNLKISFSRKKLDSYNDIIDNFNYIKTFIKNISHKDLSDFKISTSTTTSSTKTETLAAAVQTNNDVEPVIKDNPMGNLGDLINNKSQEDVKYQSYDEFKTKFIADTVRRRINQDLVSGAYYFYDSKPKIIPIIKYAVGIMSIITLLGFIAWMIIMASTTVWIVPKGEEVAKPVQLLSVDIFQMFLGVMISIMVISFAINLLKPVKNENVKYRFSNVSMFVFTFAGALVLSAAINGINSAYQGGSINTLITNGTTETNILLYEICLWLHLGIGIFMVLFVIPLILNYIFRPGINLELQKELAEKYKKEMYEKGVIK
ncbi:MAG: hypothetical protein ACRCVI_02090 [Mycoplasmoidaceae bacterium]